MSEQERHARSKGARYERAAGRARLRRRIEVYGPGSIGADVLKVELDWLLKRQERYEKKPGGLGRR